MSANLRRYLAAGNGMQATSRNTRAIHPFEAVASLGERGVLIGDEIYGGGQFFYDAFQLYPRELRSPNMVVTGDLGEGKSATMKVYCRRQATFGRKIRIIDSHPLASGDGGEFTPLVEDLGGTIVRLVKNGRVRLNPLANPDDRHQLLQAAARAVLPRELTDHEPAILNTALDHVTPPDREPILPDVVSALQQPSGAMADRLSITEARFKQLAEGVALALQPLCEGDYAGMFDGPTSGVDFDADVLSIDLSDLQHDTSLGILMSCAIASVQAVIDRRRRERRVANLERHRRGRPLLPADHTIFLMDETYRIFGVPGIGRWLQHQYKAARKVGQQNIAIMHSFADLDSAGDQGSQKAELVKGLRRDVQTFVVFHMGNEALKETVRALSLNAMEEWVIGQLQAHQAYWRVGNRRFVVQTALAGSDYEITNTDQGMSGS